MPAAASTRFSDADLRPWAANSSAARRTSCSRLAGSRRCNAVVMGGSYPFGPASGPPGPLESRVSGPGGPNNARTTSLHPNWPEPAWLTSNSPGEAMTLHSTTLETQIDQSRHDPLRVLVVGAGIAGLTAAPLLRGAGLHPIVVERARPGADEGYMLALMPMVEAALRDLDVWEPYRNASTALRRFRLRSRTGAVLRTDSMTSMLQRYGDYRGISRGRLMDVL